ncbi:hypothetical protein ILUMI_18650, partial [Ignelater luminosus]
KLKKSQQATEYIEVLERKLEEQLNVSNENITESWDRCKDFIGETANKTLGKFKQPRQKKLRHTTKQLMEEYKNLRREEGKKIKCLGKRGENK